MKKHLEYVEPTRSVIGFWKHSNYQQPDYCPSRRKLLLAAGRAIAKTGVMRVRPLIPMAVVQMLLDSRIVQEQTYNRVSIPNLITVLLGREIGSAVERDLARLETMHWRSVPWSGEDWYRRSAEAWLHSTHVPLEGANMGKVVFAESPAKLVADKFIAMNPGRYLTRFFSGRLTEGDIKKWAEKYAAMLVPAELKFIESTDRAGWLRVYEDGPHSCMRGDESVQVYAHNKSVLRLAYMVQEETILSRCIVREDVKEYIRVYPSDSGVENTQLREALESAGYSRGSLMGVLLDAKEYEREDEREDDTYVCPYLDAGTGGTPCLSVTYRDGSSYLLVGRHGVDGQTQDGYVTERPEMQCHDCGDGMDEDDSVYIESGEYDVCRHCADENYVIAIGRSGHESQHPRDNCVRCETDRNWYALDHTSDNGVYQCEVDENYYEEGDMVQTSIGMVATGNAVALDVGDSDGNSYAVEDDTVTTHDGRVIHKDDAVLRTVWCHEDDSIENDQTPQLPQQQVA